MLSWRKRIGEVTFRLDRKLSVAPSEAYPIDDHANIRPHDGYAPRKACYSSEEVAKEDDYAVCLYNEAYEGPF
jgi:hypothetical protein